MKKNILKVLASSGTTPASLEGKHIGVYIYENDVFVLINGDDIPFDELDIEEQTRIHTSIVAGTYLLDASFQ
jgi:hypothetical protein